MIKIKHMKTAKFTLPAHWAGYLINGDPTIFSLYDDGDEELAYIDQWVKMNGLGPCLDCSEYPQFATFCDADTLAGDMLEYEFEVLEPAPTVSGTRADTCCTVRNVYAEEIKVPMTLRPNAEVSGLSTRPPG